MNATDAGEATGPKRIALGVACVVMALAIIAPYVVLEEGGASPGVVGYEGTYHLLSMLAVAIATIVISRRLSGPHSALSLWLGVAGCLLLSALSVGHALEVLDVDREIAAARPDINRVMSVAKTEAQRINAGVTEPSAPEAHELLELVPPSAPRLSDSLRPLRERLVELARRNAVGNVNLTREMHRRLQALNDGDVLAVDRLIDSKARQESLRALQGHREVLDWYVAQVSMLSDQYEANIRELGLPKSSQDQMLGGARKGRSDGETVINAAVADEKSLIAVREEAVRFVESRARTVHLGKDGLVFDDPKDATAYQSIVARVPPQ